MRSWIHALEVDLLGWSLPPCGAEIAAHGWVPEPPCVACRRCGCTLGRGEDGDTGCSNCRSGRQAAIADGIVRLGPYRPPLRDWVLMIKNTRWATMGEALAAALARRIVESGLVEAERSVVVPIPTVWTRVVQRGIDHTKCIGAALAHHLGCPCASLLAHRPGPPQAGRAGAARRRQGGRDLRLAHELGGTKPRPPWLPRWSPLARAQPWLRRIREPKRSRWRDGAYAGAHLILVDDVRTTGATLRRATQLLRQAEPDRIVAAVLCCTEGDRRNSLA